MNNLITRIADHADIDTRRAMGVPPRKLSCIWSIFRPKGKREMFTYYTRDKRLTYHEFGWFDYYYTQTIYNIEPLDTDPIFPWEGRWTLLKGAEVREIIHDNGKTIEYNQVLQEGPYHTAGKPKFSQCP
jgi:hypothetical protein